MNQKGEHNRILPSNSDLLSEKDDTNKIPFLQNTSPTPSATIPAESAKVETTNHKDTSNTNTTTTKSVLPNQKSLVNMVLTNRHGSQAAKAELDDKICFYELVCMMIRFWELEKEGVPLSPHLTGSRPEAINENQLHNIWLQK